jgi:hypothetical protein
MPLLRQLAAIAMRLSLTPKQISRSLKFECVREAARHSTLINGRVNHSRVAVITGLSRAEVRRLLARPTSPRPDRSRLTDHKAWNLVTAWKADTKFNASRPSTRQSKKAVTKGNFGRLVRHYCGDVPEKAVLAELLRMGAVENVGSNVVPKGNASWKLQRDVGEAKRLIKITSDLLASPGGGRGRRIALVKRLQIPVAGRLEHHLKLKQIASTLSAAHNAISYLGEKQAVRGSAARSSYRRGMLDISTVVTAWGPSDPPGIRQKRATRKQ